MYAVCSLDCDFLLPLLFQSFSDLLLVLSPPIPACLYQISPSYSRRPTPVLASLYQFPSAPAPVRGLAIHGGPAPLRALRLPLERIPPR
jgi:hypothetical protein